MDEKTTRVLLLQAAHPTRRDVSPAHADYQDRLAELMTAGMFASAAEKLIRAESPDLVNAVLDAQQIEFDRIAAINAARRGSRQSSFFTGDDPMSKGSYAQTGGKVDFSQLVKMDAFGAEQWAKAAWANNADLHAEFKTESALIGFAQSVTRGNPGSLGAIGIEG